MVNLNIGQKIQKYRTQRGLSLRGLAEKTGITASMISQIENNAVNPSINTLKTLAETLDFPLYVLFQEDSDPEQELIVRKGEYRSIGNRNSCSARATTWRSARRTMVRATWSAAEAGSTPGMTK